MSVSLPFDGALALQGVGYREVVRGVFLVSLFWLFTLFDKNEMSDLTPLQREVLKALIKNELETRKRK